MSDWLPIFLPIIVAFGLVALLGAPIAWGLRARGFSTALVGVPAAFAVLAVSSVVAPLFGLKWNLLSPLVLSLIVSGVLWAVTRARSRHLPFDNRRHFWWPTLGALFTGLVLTYTFVKSVPGAGGISQTYDGVFHLNAVQYILDYGSASPFDLDLATPGNSAFYPALWHAFVTLVVQLSGAEITVATNAAAIVLVFLVWSVGAMGLGRAVSGSGRTATFVTSIMAASFSSFPLMFLSYGVLFPNLLSLALLPYAFIGLLHLLNVGHARLIDPFPRLAVPLVLLGALGAASFAHPNALHTFFLVSVPFVLFGVVKLVRARKASSFTTLACLGLALFLFSAIPLWFIATRNSTPWGGSEGPYGALIEALGTNPIFEGHNWVLSMIVLVGVIISFIRDRLRPLLLGLAIVIGLFVFAEGFPPSTLRSVVLGPWYADPWRLAALLPLFMLPLASVGGTALASVFEPALRRSLTWITRRRTTAQRAVTAIGFATGIAIIGTSLYGVSGRLDETYRSVDDEARVISPDEHALIERLEETVPEDSRIMANPWNGGSLVYALAQREVLVPHLGGTYPDLVWKAMNGITAGDPVACESADALNARFVLDFGTRYVFVSPENMQPELEDISGITYAPALSEVDREGEAVLYEITGCNWKEAS